MACYITNYTPILNVKYDQKLLIHYSIKLKKYVQRIFVRHNLDFVLISKKCNDFVTNFVMKWRKLLKIYYNCICDL